MNICIWSRSSPQLPTFTTMQCVYSLGRDNTFRLASLWLCTVLLDGSHIVMVPVLTLTGLQMEMVTNEIRKLAKQHEEGLHHHVNVEAIQLFDNSELVRRLKRKKERKKERKKNLLSCV